MVKDMRKVILFTAWCACVLLPSSQITWAPDLHLIQTTPGTYIPSASHPQAAVIRAAKQEGGEVTSSRPVAFLLDYAASLGITKDITKTQAYSVWLQGARCTAPFGRAGSTLPESCACMASCAGAVVVVILAAIDAAYSGDWSRIGVIPHEAELALRPLLGLLGAFHIFCGVIAAIAASNKGYNPVPATAKVRSCPCIGALIRKAACMHSKERRCLSSV
jgi:hypothetical protein